MVADHAALHRDVLGESWSPPDAYRSIRYENPDPVRQLILATERLGEERTRLGAPPSYDGEERQLEQALNVARSRGFAASE